MYGLEKNKKFDFDLEVEIKKNPKKKQEILKDIEEKTKLVKKMLEKDKSKEHLEELGILLNGYDALEKVITKIK